MRRIFLPAVVAVVAVGALVGPARALRLVPPATPARLAATVQVVVVGKVSAIEKEAVEVRSPYADLKTKRKYQIAVVKVETDLLGADKLKEIRIGFESSAKPAFELKEGQQLLLFLNKHPSADFYLDGSDKPLDVTSAAGKKGLEEARKVTAVRADPMKALKSDKAETRAHAAIVMVTHYCSYPIFREKIERTAIGAEESKLILKGLTEAEWRSGMAEFDNPPNAMTAFFELSLTAKDKWIDPVILNVPGQPKPDFAAVYKDAFTKWLAADGKNYQIKKVVPKK